MGAKLKAVRTELILLGLTAVFLGGLLTVSYRDRATAEVAVTAELLPKEGVAFETVESAAREALENWFTGEKLGQPVHMAELSRLLYEVEDVENCHLLLPEADLAGDATVLPRLGTVTLTEMEG